MRKLNANLRTDIERALSYNRQTPPVPVWGVHKPRELVLRGFDHAVSVVAMVLSQQDPTFDHDAFVQACGVRS